ncbi:TetR/AcrR family transcriptional regulator [Streptomyces sp. NBC_01264]|uniref:TetR/AcrR family transcriptional regulator n=1 Tax=Streptomyces sp. NBC_01264 TaxID=2903804 RepID=UPI0022599505|nr:TetR/AcrR family transcriptional regulator [Streptomyces sp. NBC_01264]MCX4782476.1 TetR/AcrR family transcriptional regulator [Streptomyces sp. NBC_01264]
MPGGRGRFGCGHLLQAALDAFAEAGHEGMSVRALSRRLGISHALLTARFGSKEELWFAAMEHACTQAERAWRQATQAPVGDDLEALREGMIRQVLFAAAYPQVLRIMNHEGAIDSPRIRFVIDRIVNPLRPGVEGLLDRLVAAGRIRAVPYATLHYLITNGAGAQFAHPVEAALLGARTKPTPAQLQAHAETVADLLLAGIITSPGDAGQTPA